MSFIRSALWALFFAGTALATAGCDQVSQRLSAPSPRQPAAPVQPVTIQPVPNATPNAGTDAAADPSATPKTPPPALPSSQQASPPAAQSTRQSLPAQPDQETLSTARLRQSSPLAAPPVSPNKDR